MAVPGPVTSAVSVGCHGLLRSREAECVTSAYDILEMVSRLGDVPPESAGPASARDRVSEDAQRVLDALDVLEFLTVEQVAAASQRDAASVETLLEALVDHDLAVCHEGRYRLGPVALEDIRRSA